MSYPNPYQAGGGYPSYPIPGGGGYPAPGSGGYPPMQGGYPMPGQSSYPMSPGGGGYPAPGGYPMTHPGQTPFGVPSQSAGMAYPSAPSLVKSYYAFKCLLNNLVLDVEGGSANPGARVVTWHLKNWGDWNNQLWYDDPMTGTIRSKSTGYCLDINGDTLVVNPYYPGNSNQLWERSGNNIRNRSTPHRVIDISGGNREPGAKVIVWDQNGAINQKFDSLPVPGLNEPYTRQNFFIVSEMNSKVLDISGGSSASGAKVILWPKKYPQSTNQLWYFDQQGVLHSALNDMVIDTRGGKAAKMQPNQFQPQQQWTVVGNRIVSKRGECFDIEGGQNKDGASVIAFGYKGSSNQHWRLEFV